MILFPELKKKSEIFYPAIVLDKYSRHNFRKKIRNFLWYTVIILLIIIILPSLGMSLNFIDLAIYQFRALFFLMLTCWIGLYILEAFYLSHYFREGETSYEVARLIHLSDENDLTKSFFESMVGEYVLIRLGISKEDAQEFLSSERKKITDMDFEMKDSLKQKITLKEYLLALYQNDADFESFLAKKEITEQIFLDAVVWVRDVEYRIKNSERWWTKESLAKLPSLGENWAFGKVFLLEKYGQNIFETKNYKLVSERYRIYEKEVEKIENILLKDQSSNILVVSETSDLGLNLVSALGKMILNGNIDHNLENRRIFVLDINLLLEEFSNKNEFERNFSEILIQANNAGNVILVIPKLVTFMESASQIGVNVSDLLVEFSNTAHLNIIAITSHKKYHQRVEVDKNLIQVFEKVSVSMLDEESGMRILKIETARLESKYDVFVTVQVLRTIATLGKRFFDERVYIDKIVDLLQEVVTQALQKNIKVITDNDINNLITEQTGIPLGKINENEKATLKNLEKLLHQRVIGQNLAIDSISKAIRRARAGIQNQDRPIGSFLFFGPTGVGKTETTKALAEIFFKDEEKIIRFDMSEYSGQDALLKLIGGFSENQVGVLSEKIRQQPYGILLLDEFEKTTKEVQDLFLQILDEGKFSDARGEEINARNLIIIATSNAGSDLIFEATKIGIDLLQKKDEIIEEIIKRKIFRPELLNRFDGLVIFHALDAVQLREIAKLMIKKLNKRLSQKGLEVKENDILIDYLVQIGVDPKFGARSMNRAIQDEVEGLIAEKMILGQIKSGQEIIFSKNQSGGLAIN